VGGHGSALPFSLDSARHTCCPHALPDFQGDERFVVRLVWQFATIHFGRELMKTVRMNNGEKKPGTVLPPAEINGDKVKQTEQPGKGSRA
jgi:hypothetical protein